MAVPIGVALLKSEVPPPPENAVYEVACVMRNGKVARKLDSRDTFVISYNYRIKATVFRRSKLSLRLRRH